MCCDFSKLSVGKKVVLTVAGVLYGLAMLGNTRSGLVTLLGVSLFFASITTVVFIWVK